MTGNDDYTPEDEHRSELISYAEKDGWRLEVWKPAFWLDAGYDWTVRAVADVPKGELVSFGGCGCQSVDAARSAAIAAFQEKLQLGQIKRRPALP